MNPHPARKPRVAVVFGGRSAEHAVSCATAAGVLAAIDRDRFDVVPIGIAKSGRWVPVADDLDALRLTAGRSPQVAEGDAEVVLPMSTRDRSLTRVEPGRLPHDLGEIDVVVPLLHGPFGEDGTIQGLLELADIRYVGSGVLASAVMMDKQHMKIAFGSAGLPIGPYVALTDRDWRVHPPQGLQRGGGLGLPVFVKPARAGSSVGISRVTTTTDLPAAIEAARAHDPKVVVEAAILGREIECGVLAGRGLDGPRASLPGEIVVTSGHEFYDFEAKYLAADGARLSCPAALPEDVTARVQELSVRAFEAAGCEGLARVDFFYTPAGEVIVNEVNTMPGFTPSSMFPQLWAATGLAYPDLVTELIELALARPLGLR